MFRTDLSIDHATAEEPGCSAKQAFTAGWCGALCDEKPESGREGSVSDVRGALRLAETGVLSAVVQLRSDSMGVPDKGVDVPTRRTFDLLWRSTRAACSASLLGAVRRRVIGISARDVAVVLDLVESAGSRCVVTGGWGVDALVRCKLRRHADLDLAVDDGSPEPMASAGRALASAGFGVVRTDQVEAAFFPHRRLYEDRRGRLVDLHPVHLGEGIERPPQPGVRFLGQEDVVQGRIGRRAVECLSVACQLDAYRRAPLRDSEDANLRVLVSLEVPSTGH